MGRKVFFAGSFNPFTKGHADIAERLLKIFDEVVVGIGFNIDKPSSKEKAERNAMNIREWARRSGFEERIETVVYDGLTAEEAKKRKACCVARGVRNATDFEYENALAAINRDAFGMETLLIPADPSLAYISSTFIRDLETHGRKDIAEKYMP